AERLFDDDAATRAKAGSAQPFDDRGEQWRRYGEVVSRVLRAVESFFEELERGVAVVVSVDVAQQRKQAIECLAVVEDARLLDRLFCAVTKLWQLPARVRDANHGHVEHALLH